MTTTSTTQRKLIYWQDRTHIQGVVRCVHWRSG